MLKLGAKSSCQCLPFIHAFCVWYVNHTRVSSAPHHCIKIFHEKIAVYGSSIFKLKTWSKWNRSPTVLQSNGLSVMWQKWQVALIRAGVGFHIFESSSHFNEIFMIAIAIIKNCSFIEYARLKKKNSHRIGVLMQFPHSKLFLHEEIYEKPLH